MTAPSLAPDATRCPQCRAALTGPGACTACGLSLRGPHAVRLWEVDVELLRLGAAREALQAERAELLAALRAGGPTGVEEPSSPGADPVPEPAAEWTPQRVQNALLGLGGLLLGVAALVFAAVTYDRLGAGGRAAVLLLLTAGAVGAVPLVLRRGLTSTAETLAAVALVLAALDAYGLRTLGVGAELSGAVFTAISAAVLAGLSAAWASAVAVRLPRTCAVLLAQLPVPLLLADAQASGAAAGLALAALAAADLAVVAALRSRPRTGTRTRTGVVAVAAGCAALVAVSAFGAALVAAYDDQPGAGSLALLAVAAVVAGAAALVPVGWWRLGLTAVPVGVVALAATAAARPELTGAQLPLVAATVALVTVLAVASLPLSQRTGPVAGALAVAGAAAAAVSEHAVAGVLAPVGWLGEPWTLSAAATSTGSARAALAPGQAWEGTLDVPVVLACAAVTVVAAGVALQRLRAAVLAGALLAAGAAALLPVGLDLPWAVALGVLLALGAAGTLAPVPLRLAVPPAAGGTLILLLACAWSTADRTATLVVLPLAALLLAGLSRRTRVLPGTSALLAGSLVAAEVAAAGAAGGLAVDQVGASLVLPVAALVLAAVPVLGAARRTALELAAGGTATAAAVLASADAGWLSWTLAGLALVALAGALRPDRRRLALVGGLLLSASSWVRLADAGVTHPEPYVLPLAVAALVLGHLRRRAVPSTPSSAAYGAGLSALLLPSLLASYAGSPLWRPLALGAVALVVVLIGARGRLQAPLLVGGTVLALDAVLLLAPYASALPRWLSLGAAGALLLAVGATYEQRLRDLAGLRARYDALS